MKKIISLVLAMVMVLSLCATAFAAENDGYADPDADAGDTDVIWNFTGADENLNELDEDDALPLTAKFSDVKSTAWYYKDVTECAKLGIVQGFADGTFKPDDKVTDVQLIVMLTRTFYNSKVEAAKKTQTSTWYAPNTKVASDLGISKNLTISDKNMNRYDMAVALYNIIDIEGKKSGATSAELKAASNSIKDWKSVPQNRMLAVKYCYVLGIITGMSDGTFSGSQNMTRAQACTVIMRMMKLINNYNPGDKDNDQYDDGKDQNTGNSTSGKLANGKDITVANVQAIINDLKREYPNGTRWANKGTANNNYYANGGTPGSDMANLNAKFVSTNGNAIDIKYACGGWASLVTERIFGKTGYPFREVTNTKDVRPGDILTFHTSNGRVSHYAIAASAAKSYTNPINGSTNWGFETCSANVVIGNEPGVIKWYTANSSLSATVRCWTRYPA